MSSALAIALVVSWLLLFYGLFVFDRLGRRLTVLGVQQEELLRTQEAILKHFGIEVGKDEFIEELTGLVAEGKTYEALMAYRTVMGVSYQEAKVFIDKLKN